jgi:hypothetical protein
MVTPALAYLGNELLKGSIMLDLGNGSWVGSLRGVAFCRAFQTRATAVRPEGPGLRR